MPRSRRRTVKFADGEAAHQIMTCLPARVVGQIEVSKDGVKKGIIGTNMSPDDTEKLLYQKYGGRGTYELTATDFDGRILEGTVLMNVREPIRDTVGLMQVAAENTMSSSVEVLQATSDLVSQERAQIERQQKALEAQRSAEAENMRRGTTDFVSLLKAQSGEQQKMMADVLSSLRETQETTEAARNRFLKESIENERRNSETVLQEVKAVALQQVELERERARVQVEGNDAKWRGVIEQIEAKFSAQQAQFTAQLENLEAKQELERERLQAEQEKNSDWVKFEGQSVPSNVMEKIMLRKLDIDYPAPGAIDKLGDALSSLIEMARPILPILLPQIKKLLPSDLGETVESDQLSPAPGGSTAVAPPPAAPPTTPDTGDFEEPAK